jgi:VWFA-related protein
MGRLFIGGALCLSLAAGLAAAGQQTVFRSAGDLVRVFVTVVDGNDRIVTTLKQADFELKDEGRPQAITVFDNSPRPIRLVVMLDVSGSMQGNLPLLRGAAQQLFLRLRPDDVASVGAFGREVTISPAFTRDVPELVAAIPDAIDPNAPTPLWRGIDRAIDALVEGEADAQRRVVLVLSDGKDSGPVNLRERWVSQVEVIDRARREDVMIYAVGMRSRGQRRAPGLGTAGLQAALAEDLPDAGLARVAQESGGGYAEIRFGEDLGAAFARVADELHSQYLLGFDPPKRDGKVHDIEVRLLQKGMKSRARKSYVAPKDN